MQCLQQDYIQDPVEKEVCNWTQAEQNNISPLICFWVQAKNKIGDEDAAAEDSHTTYPKANILAIISGHSNHVQWKEACHKYDKSMPQCIHDILEQKLKGEAIFIEANWV